MRLIDRVFLHFAREDKLRWMPDKPYLMWIYRISMAQRLNLRKAHTFNEKLQWLKLYDRNPVYSRMVDKNAAKEYVKGIIGEEYIIKTLGIWDSFAQIDFDNLPNQFVLKCTHDSGGMVICKDKKQFDYATAKNKIENSMKRNYYYWGREWPYKNVKPRIIAEQYMTDSAEREELKDYKFFCFNGRVECFKIDFDRFTEHHANYYDREGVLLPFGEVDCPPRPERRIDLPHRLSDMIVLAEKLSNGCVFLRVDFYEVDERIYFGELTFFPASGMGKITSQEWNQRLGQWIKLPQKE